MKPFQSPNKQTSGFSLLEVIIAIAILAILVGVVAYNASGAVEKGKTTKILQLYDTLKTSCTSYNLDTGAYPYEYSGYPATSRMLSATQTTSGWRGPYIETPLTTQMNPFGGSLHLYNTSTANGWITGFDVDGDATVEIAGACCMLWMSAIPEAAAKAIDNALDGGTPGVWSDTGRVRYTSSNSQLYMMVYK